MHTRAARPLRVYLPPTAAILAVTVLITGLLGAPARAEATQQSPQAWPGAAARFHAVTPTTTLPVVAIRGAVDGRALRLTLPAGAQPGPNQGVAIAGTQAYRYGTFTSRLRTARCRNATDGVVTGFFTYANDGTDADGNGITDNDEIDVEFLCAQPTVVYLTIWTDYSETSDAFRAITRTVDLRYGTVLSTCARTSEASGCRPLSTGEDRPVGLRRNANFDSATQFHTYAFDWRADRVTFAVDGTTLWDYRGPRTNIPDRAAPLMQNVWHTATWSPGNTGATASPATPTSAYIDGTTISPLRG